MPITYKAPFVPDYPTEEDRVTEVGPMFEAATSTNLPTDGVSLGATQPSVAPGPSVPPAGGPGTITYGETVVKPKHYAGDANQPLPWWYNEMLAKEEARKEQQKAAQREMDARYWAEQEFKRRTGNLVPKTMEEATKASMEMRRIESQLGLQYDINAGVPIEKALAKWGGNLSPGVGAYGRFGGLGATGLLKGTAPPNAPQQFDFGNGVRGFWNGQRWVSTQGQKQPEVQAGSLYKSVNPLTGEDMWHIATGPNTLKPILPEKESRTETRDVIKEGVKVGTSRMTPTQAAISDLEEEKSKIQKEKSKVGSFFRTQGQYEAKVAPYDTKIMEIDAKIAELKNPKKTTASAIPPMPQGELPKVSSQEDYAKLKSGTWYMGKNGRAAYKP